MKPNQGAPIPIPLPTRHRSHDNLVRTSTTTARLLIQAALASSLGCSSSAAVTTRRTIHSGELMGLNASGDLLLRTGDKRVTAVRTAEIKDIDHPGNIHAIVGGAIGTLGIVATVLGLPECRERASAGDGAAAPICGGIFVPLVLGVGMGLYGLITWASSRYAASTKVDAKELTGYRFKTAAARLPIPQPPPTPLTITNLCDLGAGQHQAYNARPMRGFRWRGDTLWDYQSWLRPLVRAAAVGSTVIVIGTSGCASWTNIKTVEQRASPEDVMAGVQLPPGARAMLIIEVPSIPGDNIEPKVLAQLGTPSPGLLERFKGRARFQHKPFSTQGETYADRYRWLVIEAEDGQLQSIHEPKEVAKALLPLNNPWRAKWAIDAKITDQVVLLIGTKKVENGLWLNILLAPQGICPRTEHRLYRVEAAGEIELLETKSQQPKCGPNVGRLVGDALRPELLDEASDLGGFLATQATLEAMAVDAFKLLARELVHHGAPQHLVVHARSAARDERRHAQAVGAVARRYGARWSAPPSEHFEVRALEAIAAENAVEGCVRETLGAMLARFQAERAESHDVREVMERLADDELRHAALGWSIAAWAAPRLERDALEDCVQQARSALEGFRDNLPGARLNGETRSALGLPSETEWRGLCDHVELAWNESLTEQGSSQLSYRPRDKSRA